MDKELEGDWMIKILVSGDRNWTDKEMIRFDLNQFDPNNTIVIHGAANGADTIAGQIANELEIHVREYPAMWDKYGRSAGPRRNKQMLDEENPNLVLCYHDNLKGSKGTKHMFNECKKRGIQVLNRAHDEEAT